MFSAFRFRIFFDFININNEAQTTYKKHNAEKLGLSQHSKYVSRVGTIKLRKKPFGSHKHSKYSEKSSRLECLFPDGPHHEKKRYKQNRIVKRGRMYSLHCRYNPIRKGHSPRYIRRRSITSVPCQKTTDSAHALSQ